MIGSLLSTRTCTCSLIPTIIVRRLYVLKRVVLSVSTCSSSATIAHIVERSVIPVTASAAAAAASSPSSSPAAASIVVVTATSSTTSLTATTTSASAPTVLVIPTVSAAIRSCTSAARPSVVICYAEPMVMIVLVRMMLIVRGVVLKMISLLLRMTSFVAFVGEQTLPLVLPLHFFFHA